MEKELTGKTVLITGGSRGLGAGLAQAFAERGADVAISYATSSAKAEAVVEGLKAQGVRAIAIQSDQADLAAAQPLVDKVIAQFGKLDILVNNAGIAVQGQTIDASDFNAPGNDHQWQVNVMGVVATTRAAASKLTDGGRIIFIGSRFGTHVPVPGVADYAGTKAALIGYARGAARDLGSRNITANVVQPSVMPTDMADAVLGDPAAREAILDLHPIRRTATVEEVAATVCFLAGPSGGYITGEVLSVAGGAGL